MLDFEGYKVMFEQFGSYVWCIFVEGGVVQFVIIDFIQLNGLCFLFDECLLYVVEFGLSYDVVIFLVICVYEMMVEGLVNGCDFVMVDVGLLDGICCDVQGNIWFLVVDGVYVFVFDGMLLGKIFVLQVVLNLCFGGLCGNWLFIIVMIGFYMIVVNVLVVQF